MPWSLSILNFLYWFSFTINEVYLYCPPLSSFLSYHIIILVFQVLLVMECLNSLLFIIELRELAVPIFTLISLPYFTWHIHTYNINLNININITLTYTYIQTPWYAHSHTHKQTHNSRGYLDRRIISPHNVFHLLRK